MAVIPACREGRTATQTEMALPAEVFREGFANAGKERGVVRREVEFGHQVARGQAPPSVPARARTC